jgi:hypothetical protein
MCYALVYNLFRYKGIVQILRSLAGTQLHHMYVIKPHNLAALNHSAHHPSQDPSMPEVPCHPDGMRELCTHTSKHKLIYTYHI